ncbi:hypothetical protein AYI69_g1795 [Smittium culicis]|uniref:Uncharacterized protein n=1 Tax=Smittium culicis TaxID=133412 RepID=A0A1R1YPA8_9FUNG|nr:hypothetical protein AYI69_g1795 [Smittium culicis]
MAEFTGLAVEFRFVVEIESVPIGPVINAGNYLHDTSPFYLIPSFYFFFYFFSVHPSIDTSLPRFTLNIVFTLLDMDDNSNSSSIQQNSALIGVLRTPKRSTRNTSSPYSRPEKKTVHSGFMGNIKNIISKFWTESPQISTTPSASSKNSSQISTTPSASSKNSSQISSKLNPEYPRVPQSVPSLQNQPISSIISTPKNIQSSHSNNSAHSSSSKLYPNGSNTPSNHPLSSNAISSLSKPSLPGSSRKLAAWMSPAHAQRLLDSLESYNKIDTHENSDQNDEISKSYTSTSTPRISNLSKPNHEGIKFKDSPSRSSNIGLNNSNNLPNRSLRISSTGQISSAHSLAKMIQVHFYTSSIP